MASALPVQIAMSHKVPENIPNPQGPQQQLETPGAPSVLAETTSATWMAIGLLAELLGDLDKALASYDAALRHSPNNPEALTKLANIYRSQDIFFKAAELYEQALNYNPENGDTWGLLGHCYLMLDDLQRAYVAYQRALYYLGNPNVPKLWHGIGILYDKYGSLEYAEEAFVRVLELDPNFDKANEIYFRLGIIYKHQQKLQLALECFQYILSNPPRPLTQPDVWFQIGSVLEQQKDYNGAKEAYEKVLLVNPQHAKVLQQLGCLYSQAEPADGNSNGSANSNGSNSGAAPGGTLHQDLNIALKYLLQSLEIDLTDAHTWYYLGRVHMIRGDFNAAYEAFQQAVNRDLRNPTFWCSIGVLYYQISQYRDALDAYTRAIRLNPYISEVWYDLGTLYETCNNQISDALDAYRQAERLDPGNPHIKARLDQLIKYQQEGNTHPPQPPPVSQQPRLPQQMVLESNQQQQPPQGQPPQGGPQPHLQAQQSPSQPPQAQLLNGRQANGPILGQPPLVGSLASQHAPPPQLQQMPVPQPSAAAGQAPTALQPPQLHPQAPVAQFAEQQKKKEHHSLPALQNPAPIPEAAVQVAPVQALPPVPQPNGPAAVVSAPVIPQLVAAPPPSAQAGVPSVLPELKSELPHTNGKVLNEQPAVIAPIAPIASAPPVPAAAAVATTASTQTAAPSVAAIDASKPDIKADANGKRELEEKAEPEPKKTLLEKTSEVSGTSNGKVEPAASGPTPAKPAETAEIASDSLKTPPAEKTESRPEDKKVEAVEPPLRKIEEDENYDDE